MASLRTLIVDDEPVARRRIKRLLKAEPDVVVLAEAADGRTAVDAIREHVPDLVFLDVQMPEIDGFAVLDAVRDRPPAVIFVTAFDEYALRAFDAHAVDYLLKPFTRQRFADALHRARMQLTRPDRDLSLRLEALLESLLGNTRYLTRIPVKVDGLIRIVDVSDVDWITAADNYVTLAASGKQYLVRETMDRLVRDLNPRQFVRIHRSAIVQIARIRELHPASSGDYTVILHDGTRLPLSRTFRDRVATVLRRPS